MLKYPNYTGHWMPCDGPPLRWGRVFSSDYSPWLINEGGYYGRYSTVRLHTGTVGDERMMIWKLGHVGIYQRKPTWNTNTFTRVIVLPLHERIS